MLSSVCVRCSVIIFFRTSAGVSSGNRQLIASAEAAELTRPVSSSLSFSPANEPSTSVRCLSFAAKSGDLDRCELDAGRPVGLFAVQQHLAEHLRHVVARQVLRVCRHFAIEEQEDRHRRRLALFLELLGVVRNRLHALAGEQVLLQSRGVGHGVRDGQLRQRIDVGRVAEVLREGLGFDGVIARDAGKRRELAERCDRVLMIEDAHPQDADVSPDGRLLAFAGGEGFEFLRAGEPAAEVGLLEGGVELGDARGGELAFGRRGNDLVDALHGQRNLPARFDLQQRHHRFAVLALAGRGLKGGMGLRGERLADDIQRSGDDADRLIDGRNERALLRFEGRLQALRPRRRHCLPGNRASQPSPARPDCRGRPGAGDSPSRGRAPARAATSAPSPCASAGTACRASA